MYILRVRYVCRCGWEHEICDRLATAEKAIGQELWLRQEITNVEGQRLLSVVCRKQEETTLS
jgi:hypothetical protein